MDDILEDLKMQVSRELQTNSHSGGRDNDVNAAMDVLERQCQERYKDTGSGIHFVSALLAVLVAEMLSRWSEWRAGGGDADESSTTRGPVRMVTCLYSKDMVAFVLSRLGDVISLELSWGN